MAVRTSFDADLNALREKLLVMVEKSQKAIDNAVLALKEQDLEKAKEIIAADIEINKLEQDINERAIALIAKQAPVASDLRRIIVALKISSDVERIGDLAVNIAKSTLHIGKESLIKPIVEIPKMADIVKEMLSDAVEAFWSDDVALAKKIADRDDQVDEMYGALVKELLALMTENPKYIPQITQLSFICRYLERVGDHVTNIAENIIFKVKGVRYDLNS